MANLIMEESFNRNKRKATMFEELYSDNDSDNDFQDEDFHEDFHFEDDFDNGEYQPFNPEEEEKEYLSSLNKKTSQKIVKPFAWMNSPVKSIEKSPKGEKSPSPTWWDIKKNPSFDRINGALNYASLLPPPTTKPVDKKKKQKKVKPATATTNGKPATSTTNGKPATSTNGKPATSTNGKPATSTNGKPLIDEQQKRLIDEQQKPTRFCLSVIKKSKCFHGVKCRFAHKYSELKECNFGENCKKIILIKTNSDGTLELNNKSEKCCNFKHTKESLNSYLKRIPQQHTSPIKRT
jgi:hypothetical protein